MINDDERSGGFEPLKYVADGKKVVLGLVTSKSPVLEDYQREVSLTETVLKS